MLRQSILISILLLVISARHRVSFSPHHHKMNVSQQEYERIFEEYLSQARQKDYHSSYDTKQFYTLKHSDSKIKRHSTDLHFSTNLTADVQVEMAMLRMLVDATTEDSELELLIFQSLGNKVKFLIEKKHLDAWFLPRWIDVRIYRVEAEEVWLTVECSNCKVKLTEPVLNLLVEKEPARRKRENRYRTDCHGSGKQQRCCRHKLQVVFKDLPGYDFIIQPYSFDAGFCKGSCPYRYNPANHHASLQSLIWRQKIGGAPKPCCAPSKLDHLDIIQLDEKDPTKLKVATWSNMKVIECACF